MGSAKCNIPKQYGGQNNTCNHNRRCKKLNEKVVLQIKHQYIVKISRNG